MAIVLLKEMHSCVSCFLEFFLLYNIGGQNCHHFEVYFLLISFIFYWVILVDISLSIFV